MKWDENYLVTSKYTERYNYITYINYILLTQRSQLKYDTAHH